MRQSFTLLLLWVAALLAAPAAHAQATDQALPDRPTPFAFVTDQTGTLSATEVKNLDKGLRHYADEKGPQVVVLLVKTLAGNDVSDFAKALGNKWGVGERAKDNGLVVVVSPSEHKVGIAPGTGLASQLPRSVTAGVIRDQFGPNFKQGKYYDGLKAGLNVLMRAADPSPATPAAAAASGATAPAAANEVAAQYPNAPAQDAGAPAVMPQPEEPSSGIGMGTILMLVAGAGLLWWFFKRRSAAATGGISGRNPGGYPPAGNTPDFRGNNPGGQGNVPNFRGGGPAQGQGGYGPGYGQPMGGGGSGMGGMLGTAAAAAAGAAVGGYLMNRHDHPDGGNASGFGGQQAGLGGAAGGAGFGGSGAEVPPTAGHDYFADRDGSADSSNTDYFSDDATSNSSFDSGSYDDTSSSDTGGSFDGGDSGSSGDW